MKLKDELNNLTINSVNREGVKNEFKRVVDICKENASNGEKSVCVEIEPEYRSSVLILLGEEGLKFEYLQYPASGVVISWG